MGAGFSRSFSYKNPRPKKTCAILRYGGFGDALQATSILPWLKEQGYHITFYIVPGSWEVIKHDPHIDEVVLQDVDQIPNPELGEYWAHEAQKYDKFINLSESVERNLLAMPGNIPHSWPHQLRHARMNVNYLKFVHDIAEVPFPPKVKFYPTKEEQDWALAEKAKIGGQVILWVLSGSAVHKVWPGMDMAMDAVLVANDRARFVLTGDSSCKKLEEGWEDVSQVSCMSGKWSIRQTIAFAQVADLVVGPETGVMNAIAFDVVQKILILSHSSVENLTRDWVNTQSLFAKNTSCYPCHQIHFNFKHCREVEGLAACQVDIPAQEMIAAISNVVY